MVTERIGSAAGTGSAVEMKGSSLASCDPPVDAHDATKTKNSNGSKDANDRRDGLAVGDILAPFALARVITR